MGMSACPGCPSDIVTFGGDPAREFEIVQATYEDFKHKRKLADEYDIYYYGFKAGDMGDRMRSIISCYDANYSEHNTSNEMTEDAVNSDRAFATFVVISTKPVPEAGNATELLRQEQLTSELQGWKTTIALDSQGIDPGMNKYWGPWDPHEKIVLPLRPETLTQNIVAGKSVAFNTHGFNSSIVGVKSYWDNLTPEFELPTAADIDDSLNNLIVDVDSLYPNGNPLTPKRVLIAACSVWNPIVEAIKQRNANSEAVGKWAAPIAAVKPGRNGRANVAFAFRPIIHYADGVNEAHALRAVYSLASLFDAYGIILLPSTDFDPLSLPQTIPIERIAGDQGQNDKNNPASLARLQNNATFLTRIGTTRQYAVTWQDAYDPSVTNKIVLEFTDEIEQISTNPADGELRLLIKVILHEDYAHGVFEPSTFWMAYTVKGNEKTIFSCIRSQQDPSALRVNIQSGNCVNRTLNGAGFARAWYLTMNHYRQIGLISHAYWDFYLLNEYKPFDHLRSSGDAANKDAVFVREDMK